MTAINEVRKELPDAAATMRAGAELARGLGGGMVMTLSGDLGAGKTTLVRGMLRGLGFRGAVKSPSFSLLEHYKISSLYFYHFDFYRFDQPGEWDDTGFAEYFRSDAICVIEWPEKIVGIVPEIDIAARLAFRDPGRELGLRAGTIAGSRCLAAFAAAAP